MNIFVLGPDVEGYQQLEFVREKDWDRLYDEFEGEAMRATWQPPAIKIVRPDKGDQVLPAGDYPRFSISIPTFSERAVKVLGKFLTENGEVLPLKCKQGCYFAYNVTRFVDALDEVNCECDRFDDGGIFNFIRVEFHKEKVGKFPIFKVPQCPRGDVFVTDDFVQRVLDGGLVGFQFRKMWSDEKKPVRRRSR